jgi:hypothetical protein
MSIIFYQFIHVHVSIVFIFYLQASYDDHQDLGVPDLDQHVCQAIDNSYHGNRRDPVKRLNARKKS